MPGLTFSVADARARAHAASPTIVFRLRIAANQPVEALALRAQLRIEPQWRAYEAREKPLLNDLFGTPDRWNTTLRSFSWADVSVTVPAFANETEIDVPVPCTYDFDVPATRFFNALGEGAIPIRFLFSGAIFRSAPAGFQTERVPWSCECTYGMPLEVWREAMRACYGGDALIRVNAETLERLHRCRALSGATTWDELFDRLLGAVT